LIIALSFLYFQSLTVMGSIGSEDVAIFQTDSHVVAVANGIAFSFAAS